MLQLITDDNKNLDLFVNHQNEFKEFQSKRNKRRYETLRDYLKAEFPDPIKPSLNELNQIIENLNTIKNTSLPESASFYDTKIAQIQTKIDNNDYVAEDSPEYAAKLAYEARKAAFVWPTQEELDTRAQDEQELLAYLEQNT